MHRMHLQLAGVALFLLSSLVAAADAGSQFVNDLVSEKIVASFTGPGQVDAPTESSTSLT